MSIYNTDARLARLARQALSSSRLNGLFKAQLLVGIQVVRTAIVHNLAGLFHDTWTRQVTSSGSVAHRHMSGFTCACIDAR